MKFASYDSLVPNKKNVRVRLGFEPVVGFTRHEAEHCVARVPIPFGDGEKRLHRFFWESFSIGLFLAIQVSWTCRWKEL